MQLRDKILFLGAIGSALLNSCGGNYLQRTTAASNDRVMLVEENPVSFGFKRVQALSEQYEDFALLLKQNGYPRYLGEARRGGQRYMTVYYPQYRRAYVCRANISKDSVMEYSGPYTITDNELETLQKLGRNAD